MGSKGADGEDGAEHSGVHNEEGVGVTGQDSARMEEGRGKRVMGRRGVAVLLWEEQTGHSQTWLRPGRGGGGRGRRGCAGETTAPGTDHARKRRRWKWAKTLKRSRSEWLTAVHLLSVSIWCRCVP